MSRIAILADTHMPRRAAKLPERCLEQIGKADLVIHAGDVSERSVLEEIRSHTRARLVAVQGNVDSAELRRTLPAEEVIELDGGPTLAVIHDAGPSRGRLARMRRRFPTADAVIFGHSHIPLHESAEDGFQIFNPGSPTDRRRQPRGTMGSAIAGSGLIRFKHVLVAGL